MSPEQARGREHLDARSDIYSVGAVGHFLMTGKLPFERWSFLEMLHAHAYELFVPGPEFQDSVPADLQQVILCCLKKDPAPRYQDAATLEKALAACKVVGEWTAERAEEWWRRHGEGAASSAAPEAGQPAQQAILGDSCTAEYRRVLELREERLIHRFPPGAGREAHPPEALVYPARRLGAGCPGGRRHP
jgi:hypothetical protein